jgi:ribosome-associated translation inhibitor RaiA
MCERCGAVYRKRRWRAGTEGERHWPVGFEWTVCPACVQVAAGQYFGRVILRGARALQDEAAIRRRIRNVAERARFTQTERRIVSIDRRGDAIEVLATSQKLAHRIVEALMAAFGGRGTYHWAEGDGELRATWTWEEGTGAGAANAPAAGQGRPARGGGPGRSTRAAGAARTPRPSRAVRLARAATELGKEVPVLDIRCRNIDLDPAWRTIVEEQLEIWARRYPDFTRLRVTLTHGRHHRRGIEEAAAQAVLAGRVLHATREAETMTGAIRETLRTIDRELLGVRGRRGSARRTIVL